MVSQWLWTNILHRFLYSIQILVYRYCENLNVFLQPAEIMQMTDHSSHLSIPFMVVNVIWGPYHNIEAREQECEATDISRKYSLMPSHLIYYQERDASMPEGIPWCASLHC